jgi:hypothetical protein
MNTKLLRLATRMTGGSRVWLNPQGSGPALMPPSYNWLKDQDGANVGSVFWWPCPITGRPHGIALGRHRGKARHGMRREVMRLMREGTPKAIKRARTDEGPQQVAA